jgi:hypothetical protein
MRKTALTLVCGALALLTAGVAVAQDRGYGHDRRDGRHDRRDDRWEDRRGGGVDVVLFEHRDFGGQSRPIRGNEPDLVRMGFNDQTSSFKIMRGEWEFCEDAYYRGRCWTYSYDAPVLPKKQNDRYSSLRRIR